MQGSGYAPYVEGPQSAGGMDGHTLAVCPASAPTGAPLVSYRHKSPPRGCPNASKHLALHYPGGPYIPLPCGNRRCSYCDLQASHLLATMMWLDGLVDPPAGVLTLTTVDPLHAEDAAFIQRCVEHVVRALRRRWPRLEYCAFAEFTTGQGSRSGGYRRIHFHVLLKGLPVEALPEAGKVAQTVWEARTGAHRVSCEPIGTLQALTHYMALHHRKPEQAPPDWWTGRRTRPSKGYYHLGTPELKRQAKAELAARRRLWRAMQTLGPDAPAALVEAEVAIMEAAATGVQWSLVEYFDHPKLGPQLRGVRSAAVRVDARPEAPPRVLDRPRSGNGVLCGPGDGGSG